MKSPEEEKAFKSSLHVWLGLVRSYVHYSLSRESHKLTGFQQGSWIIHWQGERNLYLRKKILFGWKPWSQMPDYPSMEERCYVNIPSTTFSVIKFMALSLVVSFITTWLLKFFLMRTVLIYKKVVYLWSFFPFSFWSKLLLAPHTMALSVLPTPAENNLSETAIRLISVFS